MDDAGVKKGDVVHTCCNHPVGVKFDIEYAADSVMDYDKASWALTRKAKKGAADGGGGAAGSKGGGAAAKGGGAVGAARKK